MSIAPKRHEWENSNPVPSHVFSSDRPLPQTRPPASDPAASRLVSLDAYRGLVMVLMISAGLQFTQVVKQIDQSPGWEYLHTHAWSVLALQTEHTDWTGCSLWDLIQPSFMFMVGTAMTFSLASRRAKGQSFARMLAHALGRSLALVLLGVFLTSAWSKRTNWEFTIVLGQIGLGYTLLFLLAWTRPRWQFTAAVVLLVGTWIAFAAYPKSPEKFTLATFNPRTEWRHVEGMPTAWEQAHWVKNANVFNRFDRWFLNLFPRYGEPYTGGKGGYQTLNFVPALVTMIFGLLAGELLRSRKSGSTKVMILLLAGALSLVLGWALGRLGICPVSKKIWSPSWTIFSSGWTFISLGLFYLVLDVWKLRGWQYPLVVVGANSIAIYCVSQLLKPFVRSSMRTHFGPHVYEYPGHFYAYLRYRIFTHNAHPPDIFQMYGQFFAPIAEAGFFLLFCWVLCAWAYRRRLFIKI